LLRLGIKTTISLPPPSSLAALASPCAATKPASGSAAIINAFFNAPFIVFSSLAISADIRDGAMSCQSIAYDAFSRQNCGWRDGAAAFGALIASAARQRPAGIPCQP
jgi:hypothetical protein